MTGPGPAAGAPEPDTALARAREAVEWTAFADLNPRHDRVKALREA